MRQLVKEKENSEFKPVKLRLKIDLVSYPARAEGLVNMGILVLHIFNSMEACLRPLVSGHFINDLRQIRKEYLSFSA